MKNKGVKTLIFDKSRVANIWHRVIKFNQPGQDNFNGDKLISNQGQTDGWSHKQPIVCC